MKSQGDYDHLNGFLLILMGVILMKGCDTQHFEAAKNAFIYGVIEFFILLLMAFFLIAEFFIIAVIVSGISDGIEDRKREVEKKKNDEIAQIYEEMRKKEKEIAKLKADKENLEQQILREREAYAEREYFKNRSAHQATVDALKDFT